jgi:metal-sulfur cluster biosynthetic enzyme
MSTQQIRVTGSDVDAIDGISEFERRLVRQIDADVEDPHIPVSIVEMGMIYDVVDDDGDITVDMTYPCMGCPAYEMIQQDVRDCLLDLEGVRTVTIEVVWDPIWSKDRLDEEVQRELQRTGTAI